MNQELRIYIKKSTLGFTLIELLVVIIVMVSLGVVAVPFYSRFFTQNAVQNTTQQLSSEIRKAQLYAMTGKQNGTWGVHNGTGQIVLFQGTSYAARNSAFDESFAVNSNVSISGLTDLLFYPITGSPSATPTITITGNNTTGTLVVNAQGILTSNASISGTWYNAGYVYKKLIDIDHTQVDSAKVSGGADLSNFPVLISFTDPNLRTVANGGYVQNTSGTSPLIPDDLIFTDSAQTIKLDHEVEKYVPTTGEIEIWVRIPTLSGSAGSTDTIIYMYYDNSSISTSQENKTGVWDSNYEGVWHLKEDPSGSAPQMADSTTNTNSFTTQNMISGDQVSGQIDGSLNFNGNNPGGYLTKSDAASLKPSGDMTISMWIKLSQTASSAGRAYMLARKVHSSSPFQSYQAYIDNTTNQLNFNWINNSGTEFNSSANTALTSTSTWYYATFVHSGTTMKIYLNGADDTASSQTTSGTLLNSDSAFEIGETASGTQKMFQGTADEIHLSSVARSAGWIATEYANQNTPASFYSVSAQTHQ